MQVTNLTILPALEALTGIPTGISTDFTKPFISQLKINGELAAHGSSVYLHITVTCAHRTIPLTLKPLRNLYTSASQSFTVTLTKSTQS